MVTVTTERAIVQQMTDGEMRTAIDALLRTVGMSRDELAQRGAAFMLDAEERSALADIEAMEWMINRD